MPKGYKVVQRLRNGDRVSAIIPKNTGLRETYISHGKARIVSEGMVFSDLYHALSFLKGRYDKTTYELWECHYGSSEQIVSVLDTNDLLKIGNCKQYKEKIYESLKLFGWSVGLLQTPIHLFNPPKGTWLAKDILLLKRVK